MRYNNYNYTLGESEKTVDDPFFNKDVPMYADDGNQGSSDGALESIVKTTRQVTEICKYCKEEEEKKEEINRRHPLTGDPEIDARIQKIRDQELEAWRKANDLNVLGGVAKTNPSAAMDFQKTMDEIYNQIPESDRKLSLNEIVKKYPHIAEKLYASASSIYPELKNMPLEYTMALSNSVGLGSASLESLKDRVDNVVNSSSGLPPAASSGYNTLILAAGALALVLIGGFLFLKKKK